MPSIPCSHCAGSGVRKLPLHLFRVLLEVRGLGRATARQVCHELRTFEPVAVTAMSNRLADLLALGFLARVREGKTWIYFLPRTVSRVGATPRTTNRTGSPVTRSLDGDVATERTPA